MTTLKRVFFLFITIVLSNVSFSQITLPYFNDFDTDTDTVGWTHYSQNGSDDWEWGIPNQGTITSAYSSPKVWMTGLSTNYSSYSTMVLSTPQIDLTNATTYSSLSFYRINSKASSTLVKFKYSTDNGVTWNDFPVVPSSVQSSNWQGVNGFSLACCAYKKSTVDISSLNGQVVKFGWFLTSSASTGKGLVIDDFKIDKPYNNVQAFQGDTIRGVNTNYTHFTVNSPFSFSNQYSSTYPFKNIYYLSTDLIIDPSDIVIDTISYPASTSDLSLDYQFELPTGLTGGTYYLLYHFDATDVLTEDDETDNVSFAVFELESLYYPGYVEDFDSGFNTDQWKEINAIPGIRRWFIGDPEKFHIENANNSENAAYPFGSSSSPLWAQVGIESPYFDLQGTTNNVFCYWYRGGSNAVSFSNPETNPIIDSYTFSYSSFQVESSPSSTRLYNWDCHCVEISSLDNQSSVKFRIQGVQEFAIDDIYVGPIKPDLSIGGSKDLRYTNDQDIEDTLDYDLFNAGWTSSTTSETAFYWSTDSILDPSDIFLGTNQEPVLDSMALLERQFTYSKPTTVPGDYYIIHALDYLDNISEMREYDNEGIFFIRVAEKLALPYSNDFEIEEIGWDEYSTLGETTWERGLPTNYNIDPTLLGQNSWETNLGAAVDSNVRTHLLSPIFNLSDLNSPTMEFDMHLIGAGNLARYVNLLYSDDGGYSWKPVMPVGDDYKHFYRHNEYNYNTGEFAIDSTSIYPLHGSYNGNDPFIRPTEAFRYYDESEVYHYSVNIEHLKDSSEEVRFMMVFHIGEYQSNGPVIDNFEIVGKTHDLFIPESKSLMMSSNDQVLDFFCHIKNYGNSKTLASELRFVLSADTIIDANDFVIQQSTIRPLRPYEKEIFMIKENTPPNFGSYNYLLYSIDDNNSISETNEINNIGYFPLDMDTAASQPFPITQSFDSLYVDGWTWYQDSAGSSYHYARVTSLIDTSAANNSYWQIDHLNNSNSSSSLYFAYDNYFMQSPPFDLTNIDSVDISFDFRCFGDSYYSNTTVDDGGNFQFSSDGGLTWTVITNSMSDYETNWYWWDSDTYNMLIESIGNVPGWGNFWYTQDANGFVNASINLDFLGGFDDVRFRFQYRGEGAPSYGSNSHGFKLKNFTVNAYEYVSTNQVSVCEGDDYTLPNGNIISNITTPISDTTIFTSNIGIDSLVITNITPLIINDNIVLNGATLFPLQTSGTFQWLDCNANYSPLSPPQTGSTYTPTNGGSYAVEISYSGCVDTTNCILSTVGIDSEPFPETYQLFPNPTKDFVYLTYPQNEGPINVRVKSADGRILLNKEFTPTGQEIEIELAGSKGIYFIEIITASNHIYTEKVVKN